MKFLRKVKYVTRSGSSSNNLKIWEKGEVYKLGNMRIPFTKKITFIPKVREYDKGIYFDREGFRVWKKKGKFSRN